MNKLLIVLLGLTALVVCQANLSSRPRYPAHRFINAGNMQLLAAAQGKPVDLPNYVTGYNPFGVGGQHQPEFRMPETLAEMQAFQAIQKANGGTANPSQLALQYDLFNQEQQYRFQSPFTYPQLLMRIPALQHVPSYLLETNQIKQVNDYPAFINLDARLCRAQCETPFLGCLKKHAFRTVTWGVQSKYNSVLEVIEGCAKEFQTCDSPCKEKFKKGPFGGATGTAGTTGLGQNNQFAQWQAMRAAGMV